MSEFSFDPKSNKTSPFQRLTSGKVGGGLSAAQNDSAGGGAAPFNRLPPRSLEGSEAVTRIAPLEAAVNNINRSTGTLEQVAAVGAEIAGSNVDASLATVRDVESAASLANDLRSRISTNRSVAEDAQVSGISPEVVERILN